MQLPKRVSLVSQTADILRQMAVAGRWGDTFPGERQLALHLQVSRVTLRAALQQLRREGTIAVRQGRHRVEAERRRTRHVRSRVIGLLTRHPLDHVSQFDLYNFSELGRLVQQAGFRLEVRQDSRLERSHKPGAVLRRMVAEVDAGCWVLWACSREVQQWLAEQRVPAVVMGTCHAGVEIPSLDHDHLASAQHAGALLRGLGHQQITLLSPRSGLAGDMAVEQSLGDGLAGPERPNTPLTILHHDSSVEGICGAMQRVLDAERRPTALVVSHASHVPTVLTFLLTRGVRVPGDISLLCLRSNVDLNSLLPSIACYEGNPDMYTRKLARLVVQLATTGTLSSRRTLVPTRFKRGQSLVSAPDRSNSDR